MRNNHDKSDKFALIVLFAFILLYFSPRGSYIWLRWLHILFEGS